MEAAQSSEMLVSNYHTTWRNQSRKPWISSPLWKSQISHSPQHFLLRHPQS